jgi:hypothetical protein
MQEAVARIEEEIRLEEQHLTADQKLMIRLVNYSACIAGNFIYENIGKLITEEMAYKLEKEIITCCTQLHNEEKSKGRCEPPRNC